MTMVYNASGRKGTLVKEFEREYLVLPEDRGVNEYWSKEWATAYATRFVHEQCKDGQFVVHGLATEKEANTLCAMLNEHGIYAFVSDKPTANY